MRKQNRTISKYKKQKLKEVHKSANIFGDFNTKLLISGTSGQNFNIQEQKRLIKKINDFNLAYIYETLHSTRVQYRFSSNTYSPRQAIFYVTE